MGFGLRGRLRRARFEARVAFQNLVRRPRVYRQSSRERMGVVFREPSDMCVADKVMIYALVRGLRPQRVLEIGTKFGGSSLIMASAMEDAVPGSGAPGQNGEAARIVSLDPMPEQFRPRMGDFHGRLTRITGYSPQDVPRAIEALGGWTDFVFIDALHTHDAVLDDARAALPYLREGGHLLFHDAHHAGIAQAIATVLAEFSGLVDCGMLTRSAYVVPPIAHQGLRLVRRGPVDVRGLIRGAFVEAGAAEPGFGEELWNYDPYTRGKG